MDEENISVCRKLSVDKMIYGLCNCIQPFKSTCEKITVLLHRILKEILKNAEHNKKITNDSELKLTHFFYTLRNNKNILKRILISIYSEFPESGDGEKKRTNLLISQDENISLIARQISSHLVINEKNLNVETSVFKYRGGFIRDEVYSHRLNRIKSMSILLDADEYKYFLECTEYRFYENMYDFCTWLNILKDDTLNMSVITKFMSYLAFEILSMIVDKLLAIKERIEANKELSDGFHSNSGNITFDHVSQTSVQLNILNNFKKDVELYIKGPIEQDHLQMLISHTEAIQCLQKKKFPFIRILDEL